MPSPIVTIAVLDTIRAAGSHFGECKVIRVDGKVRCLASATDAKTGESFTVTAPTEYAAAVELARQVGIELEDG
jgi:isoaspartyl peptidase/L-asparaginase-like protein (Ntn-hydrolase superfamily)